MEEANRKYEKDRVNTSAIIKFAIILVVVAVAVHLMIGQLFVEFEKIAKTADPQLSPLVPRTKQIPPEPKLQINPRADLQRLLEMENQTLNSYGWVDEKSGVVRIPIDQAMKLMVEREKNTKTQDHEAEGAQASSLQRNTAD